MARLEQLSSTKKNGRVHILLPIFPSFLLIIIFTIRKKKNSKTDLSREWKREDRVTERQSPACPSKCSISMEMAAKHQHFSPSLPPFIFRQFTSAIPLPPAHARSNVHPVYPAFAPPPSSPPPSFLPFARRVFICSITGACCFVPEKKQCSVTIFSWKQNSVSMCFLSKREEDNRPRARAVNRLFRYLCFDRSREKFA